MKAIARQGGHHQPGPGAAAGRRPGLLQHLEVHAARPQVPRQPAAAQGRLRGLPRRLLAQRPGHPRQLRVPQPDPAALQGRRARHADREVPLARHQPEPQPGAERRRLGQAPRPRQPRHGHDLRGAGPPLQRGEQRGGRRALDAARRREADGEARSSCPSPTEIESGTYLLYDGACGTGGMLTVAEETLTAARRASTASRSPPTSTARRSTPRPTPSARPTCCSRARATRPTTSSAAPEYSTLSQRRLPVARVRLHALQSALRQELEERPRAHGRQGRHQGPALHHRARRRPRVLAASPAPATARCSSWPTCSAR